MKNICLLLLCAGAMVISSCTDNGEIEQTSGSNLLQISTEITTRSVLESSSFSTGDEIGVFVSNSIGKEYADGTSNIKATFNKQWQMDKPVSLTESPATVYAYYPYCNNSIEENYPYISGDFLYFDLRQNGDKGQIDYLFGQAEGVADINSPNANIHFRHVLSRLTFIIKRATSDQGQGLLSSVALRSPSNNLFYMGYIYLKDGVAKDSGYNYHRGAIKINTNLTLNSETEQKVDMLVIPRTLSNAGELTLELTIDGKPYIVNMPATTWEAGQQYTYPITISRTDAHIIATPAKVGDYYYSDGSWSTGYDANRTCIGTVFALSEEKDGDINVSLSESMHGRIAALQDLTATYRWADNTSTDVEGIPNFYLADGKQDGGYLPINGIEGESVTTPQLPYGAYIWHVEKSNQYALTDYAGRSHSSFIEKEYYPAGYACFSIMSEGLNNNEQGFWYLPAIGELARLATACNANLLDPTGDSPFKILGDDYYWSSTEGEKSEAYAWCYYGKYKGILQYQVKDATYKVRPIASF